jgi:hypothetical protein
MGDRVHACLAAVTAAWQFRGQWAHKRSSTQLQLRKCSWTEDRAEDAATAIAVGAAGGV